MTDADLLFLPWARRGAATAVLQPDTFGSNLPGTATTSASLSINGTARASVPVDVMGPGHVTGLDTRQVIRTDPAPGSRTFEPNYFPVVELDEPSLPWLFTPASAGAQSRLRPWLCLVVVRAQDGVRIDPPTQGTLPVLRISAPARPGAELPDLAESWAWAHVSVTTESGTPEQTLLAELAANPERSLARLLCSRVLQPDTDYLACVVPTFELGRKAGLGQDVMADDEAHLAPAWDLAALAVELPVYYYWNFATGAGGDFQSLAMLLHARTLPPGVGTKDIDVSRSGLAVAVPDATVLPLPGALRPIGSATGGWPNPALKTDWETALTAVLNAPATIAATGDPLLAPPLYGSAQAALTTIDSAHPDRWFEQLNLAPTYRALAHVGARVVQAHQDELMTSAWAQAADLVRVNQLLRQTELGAHVATSMHERHLGRMDAPAGLQVLSPVHARLARMATGAEFAAALHDTGLTAAAYSVALRRLARPRGAINRRMQRLIVSPDPVTGTSDILLGLQPVALAKRRHVVLSSTRVSLETIGERLIPPIFDVTWGDATADAVSNAPPRPVFEFVPMGTPVPMGSNPHPLPPHPIPSPQTGFVPTDSPAAALFRSLAAPLLARFNPTSVIPGPPPPLLNGEVSAAFTAALAGTAPAAAFAARARAMVDLPGPLRSDDAALDRVLLAPYFPQPMVEPLTEVEQDLVLPGLDRVPPNTVVPLETNTAFVEAYLVGLNTEMGRELLWREYPADTSATYFDRFWNAAVAPGRTPDIDALATWGERSLGGTQSGDERFVMLVRSELLRRYPDAVIYATKAGQQSDPVFTGGFAPDVRYVGFDIGVAEIGDWSIVIQEHPSAPRFGIEVGTDTGTATHVAPPGQNSADTAQRVRQTPVRITLPTSILLGTG
jgi:hypothetical protein